MAGLPCDVCQEDTTYVLRGEAGLDGSDELIYRRWRVCVNKACEKYLHRRVSVEYYPDEQGELTVYEPGEIRRLLASTGQRPPGDSGDLPMLPWDVDVGETRQT